MEEKLTRRKRGRDDEEVSKIDKKPLNISAEKELKLITSETQHFSYIKSQDIKEILATTKDFIFGNYERYYYKRYLEALKDPRLSIFNKEWFEGKNCLDIGCNDGTLTIMVAVCYNPKHILGMDIDYKLIKSAVKNLKYVMRNNLSKTIIENSGKELSDKNDRIKEIVEKIKFMPKSFLINLGYPINKNETLSLIKDNHGNNTLNSFPNNITFEQGNNVATLQTEDSGCKKYDTILCLSVAKWIHLNYGDIGVKILFYNIYSQLNDNGYFIFEPQNWNSYKRRCNMSETIYNNYKSIKLRPEYFKDYLTDVFGFKLVQVSQPPSNTNKNFNRPIYIFQKVRMDN